MHTSVATERGGGVLCIKVLYSFFEISNLLSDIKINVFTSDTIANKCLPNFPKSKSVSFYNKLDKKIIGIYSSNPTLTLNDPNSGIPVILADSCT